jgi:hypothetical protein
MVRPPKSIEVGLDLKIFSIRGTWEPNQAERRAAWELYVELLTRIAVAPSQHGLLRESLASLHALFSISREILRRHGPDVAEPKSDGQYNLAYLAIAMLNYAIRPVLSYWHPELESWEAGRDPLVSRYSHEHAWARAQELRQAIDATRQQLAQYAALLAAACGVPDLRAAVPGA